MSLPKLIDNKKVFLADVLREILPHHKKISIATGYWDLPGTMEVISLLKDYESIRLIIGQEPMTFYKQKQLHLDFNNPDSLFPDNDIKNDLVNDGKSKDALSLRETVVQLVNLINNGKLEVKVYRKKMLHAKAYIFGDYSDNDAVGIVGSSNFTKAGLTSNTELNSLQDNYQIVTFRPSGNQEHGHLSWFDEIWNDPLAETWTGDFKSILRDSPVGDLCFGPYDTYIKTLMEVYPDELIPPQELEKDTADILYSFQNRNAGILINKLNKMGLAILADSVGLGKTITAGAVIKHYLSKDNGKANVLIIAPAALKQQWKDDLDCVLGITKRDYEIVSQQDTNAILKIKDEYDQSYRKSRNIDLFVIDEAHNLRSKSGERHDAILELLQQHPNSHILLLTATPINNSLMDIANQIQLASKGRRLSVNVSYIRPEDGKREMMDFFDALKRIQTRLKKAEKEGEDIGEILEKVKPTIHEGLRHYLVRSTRQGVEAEGGIVDRSGLKKSFPTSMVQSMEYQYDASTTKMVSDTIEKHVFDTFEGINPRSLNLELMAEFTQLSEHPLDFMDTLLDHDEKVIEQFSLDFNVISEKGTLRLSKNVDSVIPNILQCIYLMGFVPYRPEIYNYKYYGKSISQINELENVPEDLRIQLTVHNIMQITWLKRLESSAAALQYSVNNYSKRIDLFKKYLDKGYIVSLGDANLLESDYNDGEDIEQAFADYEAYLKEREELIESGKDPRELKKYGIEKKKADPSIYNIKQIVSDIERDRKIVIILNEILDALKDPKTNPKLAVLFESVKKVLNEGKHGQKLIVFSFFADTIQYLKNNLAPIFEQEFPDFAERAEFISGQNSNVENIVRKFSPKSKKYTIKPEEKELNFLFSTDVLSEGQNLQDAGYLINYDLHWNPVRMIQRNGRINRLGSTFSEVLIANMKPTEELELYLNLVHRLENKIGTIKNTVGLDQGVLTNDDVNPIEFIEKYYSSGELEEPDDLLAHTDEHILELRKFLGNNENNPEKIEFVKNIPLGKWNYLSSTVNYPNKCISLVRTISTTKETNKNVSDLFFINIKKTTDNEYIAEYVDTSKALEVIKAKPEDNERIPDNISFDRLKVASRAYGEAKRQADNPSNPYKITPQYERALKILADGNYFDKAIDLKGIIEKGVVLITHQTKLEKILRKINKETSESGSPYSSTIDSFTKLFNDIQANMSEEKNVNEVEGVLFYAGK